MKSLTALPVSSIAFARFFPISLHSCFISNLYVLKLSIFPSYIELVICCCLLLMFFRYRLRSDRPETPEWHGRMQVARRKANAEKSVKPNSFLACLPFAESIIYQALTTIQVFPSTSSFRFQKLNS